MTFDIEQEAQDFAAIKRGELVSGNLRLRERPRDPPSLRDRTSLLGPGPVAGAVDTRDDDGVKRPWLPWPVRSVVAGAAGTAAMSLTYEIERRLRHGRRELDYDDSLVPGRIVASVMHLPAVSDRGAAELGLGLRWGYGSAFGLWHGVLKRYLPEPWAAAAFGATLMTATFSLFPILGKTPPPWRWPAAVLATSIGTHVAYVATAAIVDDATRRSVDRSPS